MASTSSVVEVIAAHLTEWGKPFVELAIYGHADPGRIAAALDELCARARLAGGRGAVLPIERRRSRWPRAARRPARGRKGASARRARARARRARPAPSARRSVEAVRAAAARGSAPACERLRDDRGARHARQRSERP